MNHTIQDQYATGLSRNNIEHALRSAGKDLDRLAPADLALLEDFHTMGRIATAQLVELAQITGESAVLDAGSGVGGTARYIADRYGSQVTAVDLTDEYCETNRWLNRLVGLDNRISVHRADVTELPFPEAAFDVAISQHVQMNIPDKARLYSEARRVLKDGGRLALWDITIGDGTQLDYPLPWADHPARSHLVTPDELRAAVESAGFAVEHWNDLTDQAASLSGPSWPSPSTRWACTPSSPTSSEKPKTSPGPWTTGACAPSRRFATANTMRPNEIPDQRYTLAWSGGRGEVKFRPRSDGSRLRYFTAGTGRRSSCCTPSARSWTTSSGWCPRSGTTSPCTPWTCPAWDGPTRPGARYGEPELRGAVVEFVRTLGLREATLAGESMGAAPALLASIELRTGWAA